MDTNTGKITTTQAVALGLGSLFNHSTFKSNIGWIRDLSHQVIVYRALEDVLAGEELCINYGRLWFADADELHFNRAPCVDEDVYDIGLDRIESFP